jgi:hypothetical protein
MEDEIEDDTLAVPVPGLAAGGGSAAGYGDELRGLRKDMAAAQEQAARLRKQQLDAATAALRARRMGPSTAEQLFALSAAFAQPRRTRGGAFAATMSNVMPVLGQMAAAKRTGETSREDQLRALQDAYATGEVEGTQQSLTSRLNLLKAEMAANKPRSVYSANPVTGEMFSRDSGRPGARPVTHPAAAHQPGQGGRVRPQVRAWLGGGDPRIVRLGARWTRRSDGHTPVWRLSPLTRRPRRPRPACRR